MIEPGGTESDDASAELVRRARDGDEAAFGELMRLHYNQVFHLVFGILRDEHDARDVCQEVWLKAWRKIGGFRGDAKFTTWMHPIAVRRAIDHVRKRRRWFERFVPFRSEVEDDFDATPAAAEPVGTDPDPGSVAEGEERKLRFERALASLPPKHRAVLTLREVEGLSYEEIARAINCRPGTVMSRLFHARRKLLRILEDSSCE